MTQQEQNVYKIELLKNTIIDMYTKQGYPKARIAKMLYVDRKLLTKYLNDIWKIQPANQHLTPSQKKWLNRHRMFIKSKLDQAIAPITIARQLGLPNDKVLINNYFVNDRILKQAYHEYLQRKSHCKFKRVIVDNRYEFKTQQAFAKFFNISISQAQKYLTRKTRFNHKLKFYY